MNALLILGIDTSGKTASSALFDTENEVFLSYNTLYTQKTHSQVIMPMAKNMLADTGKTMSDIDLIAVADGPGSYTGLRIGVSAVKAMSFALNCKCTGVSTLKALAYNNVSFAGSICSVMKARGELVYSCTYKSDGYQIESTSEEKILSRNELAENLAFTGNTVLLCGDGAVDFFTDYRSSKFILASPQNRLQSACGVCLGAMGEKQISPDELEVSYLQKVKAEKDLENNL